MSSQGVSVFGRVFKLFPLGIRSYMPRITEVTVPKGETAALISRVRELTGVVGVSVQYGASLVPPGDILTLQTTNDGTRAVVAVLSELGVMDTGSVVISKPQGLISPAYAKQIDREGDETSGKSWPSFYARSPT